MKISKVGIELDYDGVRALLASADVQKDLTRRGENMAKAARDRGIKVAEGAKESPAGIDLPVTVVDAGNAKRARAQVFIDHPSGMRVEAKHRLLVGSLDAART